MSGAWKFAAFRLELASPLHAGSWRAGMVAQSHRFVPGHLFSYALAAAYGGQLGGRPEDYAQALQTVLASVRFAPAFLADGDTPLFPKRDRETIEHKYLRGNNHVTLQLDSRSAQDKALFEIEYVAPVTAFNQPTQLLGGCWTNADRLGDAPWGDWLARIIIGGEGKTGYGRVRMKAWDENACSFHGLGRIAPQGLIFAIGDQVPGPALAGVHQTPMQPWLGRLYDKQQGFGRRLSAAAFVYMDGVCEKEAAFMPHDAEIGLGCWTPT
jgi:hypothetical protein